MTTALNKRLNLFKNPIIKNNLTPFGSDTFAEDNNLEKFANNIESLVSAEFEKQNNLSYQNSLIISISAEYGFGKTTFVDMWGMRLVGNENIALKFDAWKCDYTDEPALSFFGKTNEQLKLYKFNRKMKKLMKKLRKMLPEIVNVASSIATAYAISYGVPLNFKATGELITKLLDGIGNQEKILKEFQKNLSKFVEYSGNKTIYFFIDELDRCNPIFAVKLLEIIKHIFLVKGIVFILSLNQQALRSTISEVYGFNEEQSNEYLERFFDFQLKLPRHDTKTYAKILLEKHLDSVNQDVEYYYHSGGQSFNIKAFALVVFQCCCDHRLFNLSLRYIEKLTKEIMFFLNVNKEDKSKAYLDNIFVPIAIYLICLKRKDVEQYEALFSGRLSSQIKTPGLTSPFREIFYYTFELLFKSSDENELSLFLAQGENKKEVRGLETYFANIYGSLGEIKGSQPGRRQLSDYQPTLNLLKSKLDFIHETIV